MTPNEPTRTDRPVRLYTDRGIVQGTLRISGMLRTLDDLNLASRAFVALQQADATATGWGFDPGPLAVQRQAVLFVVEDEDCPRGPSRGGAGFSRAPVRLRVGEFDIDGFVHVPPGGAPLARIQQGGSPFLAVTSASIAGPDTQLAAGFVAVNRHRIVAAQAAFVSEQAAAPGASDGAADGAAGAGVTVR